MTSIAVERKSLAWATQPQPAQMYVATVVAAGTLVAAVSLPLTYPRPALFAFLLAASCLTSALKVNLPIALASGSTLSVSYAADLMALLLLGPQHAVIIASAGAWTQCTFRVKRRYPAYRTVFSTAAEALTMAATGVVYVSLGGTTGPFDVTSLIKPLVAAIATYFVVNTGLVAGAIALSTGRSIVKVWRNDFLWSGASYMVAGSAGALAAVVIDRGEYWKAILMLAPIYLTYRTYQLFVARLQDQKQHLAETRRLIRAAIHGLRQARQAEKREQAARTTAEEANRLKDQFLAMVSHELRTPLNAILGWSDMLRSGRLEPARRDRAAQAIYESARRQAQLIEELLDVARIMSGKLRLERDVVQLPRILHDALEVVQAAADAKAIRITVNADAEIGPLYADGPRLQQVFWNLLSNAVKFTPEGGAVHVRVRRARNLVEVVVTDTGEGIPDHFLPWVFEPFRQADGSTTRPHGGLGLGLSIVKHLVEAHGGTITAESGGQGHGASFIVRLPIGAPAGQREADTAPIPDAASAADTEPTSLAGLSVLVVDDDHDSLQVVAAHLENHRARVRTASSSAEAFDVLQRERVDVLLADVAMPQEDGYALIQKVRAMGRADIASIPAAALTAFAREEDRRRALQAGFHVHLSKPIDAHSLVSAVSTLGKLNLT
jgi:signal transduction histidine kinase/ActR/RegA family two-component response regulator